MLTWHPKRYGKTLLICDKSKVFNTNFRMIHHTLRSNTYPFHSFKKSHSWLAALEVEVGNEFAERAIHCHFGVLCLLEAVFRYFLELERVCRSKSRN